jgi:hypothetical protein
MVDADAWCGRPGCEGQLWRQGSAAVGSDQDQAVIVLMRRAARSTPRQMNAYQRAGTDTLNPDGRIPPATMAVRTAVTGI